MAQDYFQGFTERKARVKILILGAYRPTSSDQPAPCRERLEELRNYLNSMGYTYAKLVADFPDVPRYDERDEVHFELKSKDMILHWATGLVFVFLLGCDNEGVGAELTFVDTQRPNLFHSSAILLERHLDPSTLTRGVLIRQRIEAYEFEDDATRDELALGACAKIVYRNYWQI